MQKSVKKLPLVWVILGVSGVGKSSIGTQVAQKLGWKFIDGDDLHPRANLQKMVQGVALDDADRIPWLERINDVVFSLTLKNEQGIIVCSALKKSYRDAIRHNNAHLGFLYLSGDFSTIFDRINRREGHFMKADMLKSQFAILEEPTGEADVVSIKAHQDFQVVVKLCLDAVARGFALNALDSQG